MVLGTLLLYLLPEAFLLLLKFGDCSWTTLEIGHGSVLVEPTLCALGESSSLLEVLPPPSRSGWGVLRGGCCWITKGNAEGGWGLSGLASVPPGVLCGESPGGY